MFEEYSHTRDSLLKLLGTLSDDQLVTSVPATPGWSVLDVASHLTGVARSFATGKFEGAPGPAWTEGHVQSRKQMSLPEIVSEWDGYLDRVREAVEAGTAGVVGNDAWCHEQDIRGALKIPGNRYSPAGIRCQKAIKAIPKILESKELPVPTVIVDDVVFVKGGGLVLSLEGYEASRLIFGRRSTGQMLAMDWSDDPGGLAGEITIFGPSEQDIFDD